MALSRTGRDVVSDIMRAFQPTPSKGGVGCMILIHRDIVTALRTAAGYLLG
ncbi:hypothetical protein MPEAHAMD_6476 [Methylobacterium frigidaeris]|uniref:Uncharacterized protein n=1 Tax=Methylobacterium frigidaeris TaxID=2038277 RepID=A0AA37M8L9_9HYPH|nr:hypothetical protein MPEAHAMD_6476 [Methylobacterium frigidaeris]